MQSVVLNKKTVGIPKERKIFLNNMNSWFSNFVIESLRTESILDQKVTKNEFMGTKNSSNIKLPHLFEPQEIKIDYNFHYEHEVFKNDVFIYNLEDSDYNEIEYIIKGLKTLQHISQKTLIIISSIMTWARTPAKVKKEKLEDDENNLGEPIPEESEDEAEIEEIEPDVEPANEEGKGTDENPNLPPPKKVLPFKDKDYKLRIPAKKYYHYKMIETLALSAESNNSMLKTYIICPGFIYGHGEDIFYEYFKMAWLMDPIKLPIIGDGKNSIPTIHIADLVSLIKRIIEKNPKPMDKYIFAVDRTKNRQLKNVITSISKSTGSGQVELLTNYVNLPNNIQVPAYNELSISVKCKTSKVFDDEKGDDEDQEDFDKRSFKWHCEFGIPDNLEKLREEFTKYRELKSLKIFITGPPASGKSYISERLSKFYNLPHIKISDIVEYGKALPEGDALGDEIRAKIEEQKDILFGEMEEAIKKGKNKQKKTDAPLDRNNIKPRLEIDLILKIFRSKLKENLCRNRGYILDGFPRSYDDALKCFYEADPEKAEDDPNRLVLLHDILPNSVIKLENTPDDFLKQRLKNMAEFNLTGTHYTEEGMNRRLGLYKTSNESIKGDPSLTDFFTKNKVEVVCLDSKSSEGELIQKAKIFFERNGEIKNYQKFDEVEEVELQSNFDEKLQVEVREQAVDAVE